jgi:23S rRNA (cytosine1962-C5)-methyltransferase
MTTVHLKPHKEESLLRFHPWVFSGAIRSIQLDADYPHAQPQEGEVVQVVDSNGKVLGVGHYQIGSIAVRILAFGIGELPHDYWHERIRAAYKVRASLGLITTENNTYRLVHGEGDFLP